MPHAPDAPAADQSARCHADSPAASPLPAIPDPLDGLVAESPPEHTLVGHGLVWTLYASAAATIATLGYRTLAWDSWDAGSPLFWILALIFVLELWLGRAIQKFSVSGFYVGMIVVAGMIFGGVNTVLDSATLLESLAGSGAVVLGSMWMKYLREHRPDFT